MASGAIVAEKPLTLFEFAAANIPLLFEHWKKRAGWQFLHEARRSVCLLDS
jgi:hypothetical protein